MNIKIIEKPSFSVDQMVNASTASKRFGEIRKRAKEHPLLITEKGIPDTIIMGYQIYEDLFQLLDEYETKLLEKRIGELEKDPSRAVPWKSIRRSGV